MAVGDLAWKPRPPSAAVDATDVLFTTDPLPASFTVTILGTVTDSGNLPISVDITASSPVDTYPENNSATVTICIRSSALPARCRPYADRRGDARHEARFTVYSEIE